MNSFQLITAAASFASEAHGKQTRDELGDPYIVHPLRVAAAAARFGYTDRFIAACLLHDVLEDTTIKEATLRAHFPTDTVDLVVLVSKWWPNGLSAETVAANKAAYYAQIRKVPQACLLKILDRTDNLLDFAKMARMSGNTRSRSCKYFVKTTEEFPILVQAVVDVRPLSEYTSALNLLESVVSPTSDTVKTP